MWLINRKTIDAHLSTNPWRETRRDETRRQEASEGKQLIAKANEELKALIGVSCEKAGSLTGDSKSAGDEMMAVESRCWR